MRVVGGTFALGFDRKAGGRKDVGFARLWGLWWRWGVEKGKRTGGGGWCGVEGTRRSFGAYTGDRGSGRR
jgi:hypothetical protein